MSRRANPDAIAKARRVAVRNRLMADKGMSEQLADRWVAAWEAHDPTPAAERAADYWHNGTAWIFEHLKAANLPPPRTISTGDKPEPPGW